MKHRKIIRMEANGRWVCVIRSIAEDAWIVTVGYEGNPIANGSDRYTHKSKALRIAKDWIDFEA